MTGNELVSLAYRFRCRVCSFITACSSNKLSCSVLPNNCPYGSVGSPPDGAALIGPAGRRGCRPGKHRATRQKSARALLFLGNDPKTQRQNKSAHLINATYSFIINKTRAYFLPTLDNNYSISNNHLTIKYIIY